MMQSQFLKLSGLHSLFFLYYKIELQRNLEFFFYIINAKTRKPKKKLDLKYFLEPFFFLFATFSIIYLIFKRNQ